MKREVLKTFLALSTSASDTLKHSRILQEKGGRERGREGGRKGSERDEGLLSE